MWKLNKATWFTSCLNGCELDWYDQSRLGQCQALYCRRTKTKVKYRFWLPAIVEWYDEQSRWEAFQDEQRSRMWLIAHDTLHVCEKNQTEKEHVSFQKECSSANYHFLFLVSQPVAPLHWSRLSTKRFRIWRHVAHVPGKTVPETQKTEFRTTGLFVWVWWTAVANKV